jgi:predicted RNase H-like HicB family nuclease
MSGKSRNSDAKGRASESDPARPFDPAILDRAKRIADDYEIVMWFEDGQWYAHGLELPHTYGDGKTPAACISSVREGLMATVATMLEDGERPPAPARTGERTEQINVRLTASEKALLENRSRTGGFKGISDYVRAAALTEK